jgi:hypothetical protein
MPSIYKFPRLGSRCTPIAYSRRRSSLESDGTEGSNGSSISHCDYALCPLVAMPHSMPHSMPNNLPTSAHPRPPNELLQCEFFSNEAELRQRDDELFYKQELLHHDTLHPLASKNNAGSGAMSDSGCTGSRRMSQFRFSPPDIVVDAATNGQQGTARFNTVRRLSRSVRKRSYSLPPDSMPPAPPVIQAAGRARGISFPQTSGWYESSDDEEGEPVTTPTRRRRRMRSMFFGRLQRSSTRRE